MKSEFDIKLLLVHLYQTKRILFIEPRMCALYGCLWYRYTAKHFIMLRQRETSQSPFRASTFTQWLSWQHL